MNRAVFSAVVAIAMLPGFGAAQSFMPDMERGTWGPRVRITPFVGQAAAANRLERLTLSGSGGTVATDYEVDLAAGPAVGLAVEVLAVDRFAFIGSFAMVSRGRTSEYSTAAAQFYEHEGSNFMLAKGAIAIRLREQVSELQVHTLTATVFAGPAFIREMPKDDPILDPPAALLEPLTHWGVNFGVNAEIPLGWNSLAVQAGAEDYYTWWNNAEFGNRYGAIVEADPSHMWLFRAGLSFRLQ